MSDTASSGSTVAAAVTHSNTTPFSRMSQKVASRWRNIQQLITNKNVTESQYSVRRHAGFGLFSVTVSNSDSLDKHYLTQHYTLPNSNSLSIRLRRSECVTLNEVSSAIDNSIDNTGNVCVWPSEEVLAHVVLNRHSGWQREEGVTRVCELGAGMSALAGIALLASIHNLHVTLTDGNSLSVEELSHNAAANSALYGNNSYTCATLKWNRNETYKQYKNDGEFDLLMVSDCLFFRDYHIDLAHVINTLLSSTGVCYIVAPKRGDTLNIFVTLFRSTYSEYTVTVEERYDEGIWQKHQSFLQSDKDQATPNYDPDLHLSLNW